MVLKTLGPPNLLPQDSLLRAHNSAVITQDLKCWSVTWLLPLPLPPPMPAKTKPARDTWSCV